VPGDSRREPPIVLRHVAMVRSRVAFLCAALIALVALSGVFASPARAECDDIRWELRNQWNPFGGGLNLIRVPVCYDFGSPATKPEKKQEKKKAKRTRPTRKQLRALRYVPSPAISADVRQRLLDELVGDAQGETADKAREIIGSGNLLAQFHASVRVGGWSTRDLGDMFANGYIQMWLAANEKSRISGPVVKAVGKDLRSQLALDRDLARSGDAAQQERAEWIGSMTAALIGSVNAAKATGDPASVAANLDYLRERADDFDLFRTDLTQIRLTKRGIARR
jgi:hypothetical protein